MDAITVRPLDAQADIDWYYALNEACVPEVNSLSADRLAVLIGRAAYAGAAWIGDRPAGVAVAFAPDADYDSLNFQWFRARYSDFVYLDRIMVQDHARGLGVGKALYHDMFEATKGRFACVGCEVNSVPPNPRSMAFHESLGFQPVGQQQTEGGAKSVVLLRRDLVRA